MNLYVVASRRRYIICTSKGLRLAGARAEVTAVSAQVKVVTAADKWNSAKTAPSIYVVAFYWIIIYKFNVKRSR